MTLDELSLLIVGRTELVVGPKGRGHFRKVDMLQDNNVAARSPAQDLQRARSFYSNKLGLDPVEERPGGPPLPMWKWPLCPVPIVWFAFGGAHANGMGRR
jgi:hypothetical protein